jgi:NAD(P)-dependent dehydrogenase (short-subunit alcohol dehydrogenase family)
MEEVGMTGLTGKRVLVTGATAGIGKETARALAGQGAEVIIVGRNEAKTRATVEELKASTGQAVDFLVADLSSLAAVRKLAEDFQARWDALHVLVNNAGALNLSREVTVDGFERTFATNHLSYFLLTNLLLPQLEKGGAARVVSVASEAHRGQQIDWDDLQSQKSYAAFRVYGRSKLMNILFTRELARRVKAKGLTANSLHPGVVASSFLAKPGLWGVAGKIAGLFMISSEKGAQTSIYLASSPDVEGVTGGYFDKSKTRTPTKEAQDDEAAQRLWAVSEELAGLKSSSRAA